MGRVAFVFPGQGAQYPGMGKELAEVSPAAAEVFRAVEALRPGTVQQCFSGTAEYFNMSERISVCALNLGGLQIIVALYTLGVISRSCALLDAVKGCGCNVDFFNSCF